MSTLQWLLWIGAMLVSPWLLWPLLIAIAWAVFAARILRRHHVIPEDILLMKGDDNAQ